MRKSFWQTSILFSALVGCSSTPTVPEGHRAYRITSTCYREPSEKTFIVPDGFQSMIISGAGGAAGYCNSPEDLSKLSAQLHASRSADASLASYCKGGQAVRKVQAIIDVRLPKIKDSRSVSLEISSQDDFRKLLDEKMRKFFIEAYLPRRFGGMNNSSGDRLDSIGISALDTKTVKNKPQLSAITKALNQRGDGLSPLIYLQKTPEQFTLSWPEMAPLYFDHREKAGFVSVSSYAVLESSDLTRNNLGYKGIFKVGPAFTVGSKKLNSIVEAEGHPFSAIMKKYVPRPTVEWLKEKQIAPDDFRYFGWLENHESGEYESCIECLSNGGQRRRTTMPDDRFGTWQAYARYFSKVMKRQCQNPQLIRYHVTLDTEGFCKFPVPPGKEEEDL